MRKFARWDESAPTEMTNEVLRNLASWHSAQLSDEAAEAGRSLLDRIDRSDFLAVCDFDFDYSGLSALDAYHLRQIVAFYSKRDDIDVGVNKEAVAYVKFEAAELLCRDSNELFDLWGQGKFQFFPCVEEVFHLAQRKISQVLGELPPLSQLRMRFGPGATTQVKKRDASARTKLSQSFSCSEDLLPLLSQVLEEMPSWIQWTESDEARVTVDVTPGKLDFVPKTMKTHRSIAVEPMLNQMVQLGIGDVIAQRLSLVGVNIRDQSRNQRLAREGSFTGALATLDLSSASDTVSRELVFHLLPWDWADFLDMCRTSRVSYRGKTLTLHKFSSMGNGFTFPLETLIFWGLTSAVVKIVGGDQKDVSVYGDDIICPTEAVPLLMQVLHASGFIVNRDKSFWSGPFRESCGKDYLSGIDIRPAYVTSRLSCADAFVLHNYYARNFMHEPAQIVLQTVPEALRLWGPDGYGDGHLLGEWTPQPRGRNRGWGGYTFETFSFKPRRKSAMKPGDFVFPLYSVYVSENRGRGKAWYHPEVVPPVLYDDRGALYDVYPGVHGYRRMKVYTFCTS